MKVVPDVYEDGAKQTVTESGKIAGRIPRAINAALAGIDIWIMNREYKVAEVKKILEQKLENVNPDNIVPPEPYIAVPAWQAISYSMDNDELREMYANLLAKAMNIETKNNVHPAYVEIIKQMSPLDAKNLSVICESDGLPIASFCYEYADGSKSGNTPLIFLDNQDEEDYLFQATSISSLSRLGLINIDFEHMVFNKDEYKKFEKSEVYTEMKNINADEAYNVYNFPKDKFHNSNINMNKGVIDLTPMGDSFVDVCIKL